MSDYNPHDVVIEKDYALMGKRIIELCSELRKFRHFETIMFDSSIVLECLEETLKDYQTVFNIEQIKNKK